MSNYRVKFKKGEFEIEVKSTDKEYVDKKVNELLNSESKPVQTTKSRKLPAKRKVVSKSGKDESNEIDIPAIVEAINNSDQYKVIEKHILSKSAQLLRIVMCLKFAESVLDPPYLTTGNIETITDQLGIRIKRQNVANVIKANQKYFTADNVRKPGAIMRYKLNRNGLTAFDTLLTGEKLS